MRDTVNCIKTFTGKMVNPFRPLAKDICIEDIAHALSQQVRFTGHTSEFYSVAEHSVRVSRMMPTKALKLAALMHDASEAYLADIATPVKRHPSFAHYKVLEKGLMVCIFSALKIPENWDDPRIKVVDRRMCATEALRFMNAKDDPGHWDGLGEPYPNLKLGWADFKAKILFLSRYKELTNEETVRPYVPATPISFLLRPRSK